MSKTTTCASTRTRLHVTAHAYAPVMTRVLHPYSLVMRFIVLNRLWKQPFPSSNMALLLFDDIPFLIIGSLSFYLLHKLEPFLLNYSYDISTFLVFKLL